MNITTVTFTKRKNIGDYNHEELSLSAVLDDDDCASECIAKIKQEVFSALGYAVDPVAPAKVEEAKPVKKAVKKAPAKKTSPAEEGVKAAIEDAAVKPEPKKEVKKAPVKAVKMVPYNREEQSHKTEFAKVLVGINPDWKKECAMLAKEASVALNGSDFMDDKGVVLASFIAQVEAAITSEL